MKQPTIYDNLTRKLGRKPTHQEIKDEVKRILNEALIDRAEVGKLSHQRKGKKFKIGVDTSFKAARLKSSKRKQMEISK